MAIPEPNNELYAAVKAISNPWPPDNEDAVRQLAQGWRKAAQAASQSGTQVGGARDAATGAWRDPAGAAFGSKLTGGVQSLQQVNQSATQVAASADRYAQALVEVKTAITQVIAANLPLYLQLGNPLYGAEGQARQQQLVTQIANHLKALVAGKAGALGAGPPPPPPPPARSPEEEVDAGDVGDVASWVAMGAGTLALIPVLTPFAAPVAVLAGATALAMHSVDAVENGQGFKKNAYKIGGDAVGMLPLGKALWKAADGVQEAASARDVAGAAAAWADKTMASASEGPVSDELDAAGGALRTVAGLRG